VRERIEPEEEPEKLPENAAEVDAHLARALRLFDRAEYHAAHELLDELWLATQGEDSDFFKGLIQASIALHHFERGNLAGTRKLYAGHRRLLAGYLSRHRGIDVEAFLAAMQAFLRPVVRAREGQHATFDRSLRPRLATGGAAPEPE